MANTDKPNGLKPIGTIGQSYYRGEIQRCVILGADTTNTFIGDPVKLSASGADSTGKFKAVTQAAATNPIYGVIVGIEPQPFTQSGSDDLQPTYVAGSVTTDQYVLVDIDPNSIFEIQEVSGGTPLAAADIGLNASIVVGTGDTTTGASAVELNNATEAVTATLELKIMSVIDSPGNALGEHCKFAVKINNHQLGSHTGTAGV